MKRILIIGAGGPPGVNFINSLRFSGEKMYLVGTDIDIKHLEWPNLDKSYLSPYRTDEPGYIDFINRVIEKEGIEFIHPQPDCGVKVLSQNRDKINAKTLLPSKKTIEICQDKYWSAFHWKATGIHTIETFIINNNDDIKNAGEMLGYPFWMRARQGAGGRGSSKIDSYEMGVHWLGYWQTRKVDWEFIAQKYLNGDDFAFQSLWKDGKLITSQVRQRLELIYAYLAPSLKTGTPTIAKTVERNDINEIATRAIKCIAPNATGIFCCDLTSDNENIIPTEINPGRFFTTSFFFTKAGVNMPYYYVKMAYGEELPELKKYNAVGKDVYWLRHIDCPAVLLKEGAWTADVSFC